ncbi:MAG: hypothetical protein JXB13_16095 [Phycisphaerae bacterium]|nr:hypothetical protein [Phycisphaerae bacterium]
MATRISRIEATFVNVANDGEVVTVGFADHQYETQEYVLLTRLLDPSESDRESGEDDVHISVNDQIRSTYGGIERITLSGSQVLLELSIATADEIQVEPLLILNFKKAAVDLGGLWQGLELLCNGYVELRRDT